jgi:hypothetical protein
VASAAGVRRAALVSDSGKRAANPFEAGPDSTTSPIGGRRPCASVHLGAHIAPPAEPGLERFGFRVMVSSGSASRSTRRRVPKSSCTCASRSAFCCWAKQAPGPDRCLALIVRPAAAVVWPFPADVPASFSRSARGRWPHRHRRLRLLLRGLSGLRSTACPVRRILSSSAASRAFAQLPTAWSAAHAPPSGGEPGSRGRFAGADTYRCCGS